MKKVVIRIIVLALSLTMLLSTVPMRHAEAAGFDGIRTYRALLIGNMRYESGQLSAPVYDVAHMEQLLLQQDYSGNKFDPRNIVKLTDATKLQILETIKRELAASADGDDVTYFYYSGHGTFDGNTSYLVGVEMALISIDELKAALDAVQGQKVVIIDSCYSGGFAGRAVGSPPKVQSSIKNPASGSTRPSAASPADECAQYQSAILEPFMQQQPRMQRALTTSSYKVLSAAAPFQYSYEYRFNNTYTGVTSYGPEFKMNGQDFASDAGNAQPMNYSGEFTGMLVAGAGRVSFNPVFPEIKALADMDRDRRITLDELYRYLRGAVIYSTVQAYPENDQTVLFEHSAAETPDWGNPALYVEGNDGPQAPTDDSPVRFDLLCSPDWQKKINIRHAVMIGDNRYADNADAEIDTVASLSADSSVPDGAEAALFWDGKRQDGTEAGDGWYFAEVCSDRYKYPPIPFELSRGVSNFPEAAALPQNTAFTAALAASGNKRWYSFTPAADGLLQLQSINGSSAQNPEAELFDSLGNSLAYSDDTMLDSGDTDINFKLLRVLKGGQKYFISLSLAEGSGASLSILSRYCVPSANNTFVNVDSTKVSYTLFRPDVSGRWTIKVKRALDDDNAGVTLYDSWLSPVATGERYAESYRYICTQLEAGRLYILETPKSSAATQVGAYGPGRQPALNTAAMAALSTSAGLAVKIAHAYDTQYFRFTPSATNTYRFYSTSPIEGISGVDSYAFLMDSKGYVLASDDDVNYEAQLLQFDFTARLDSGITYVLAVRAYVSPGQLSSTNPNLDFTVYAKSWGTPQQSQAVSTIVAGDAAAIALYDDDGILANGIGSGGRLAGWGASVDGEHDGMTGLDFGEGEYIIRRWAPQILYMPTAPAMTRLWSVGHAFVARDTGRGYSAWGISTDDADFGYVRRLDNVENGLAQYDITDMKQGLKQDSLYFMDSLSGKLFSMQGLGGTPVAVPAPDVAFTKMAVSESSLFALDSTGILYSKGANRYGECGSGNTNAVANLSAIALPESIADFAAGDNHVVALDSLGNVYAWGCNDYGSLGLNELGRLFKSPVQVSFAGLLSPGESITSVFAGGGCSAVLTSAGRVLAWGANDFGQLGIGSTFSAAAPAEVPALSPAALGAGKTVKEVVFGSESSYAIISDGSVYVCGRNDYGQLGFVSGRITTFTLLSRPDLRSDNNRLSSLTVSAGTLSPSFSPETLEYNVRLPEGVALCTIQAAKADATAALTIDGQPVTSKAINAGPGPVKVNIEVTAQNGERQTYVLNIPQSPSANALLSGLEINGGVLASPLNQTDTAYSVVIPETVTTPVTITPVLSDPNSSCMINGAEGLNIWVKALTGAQAETVQVLVTAQQGNTRQYSFTIAKKPILMSVSSSPVYSGYGSLSPGGTNKLTLKYAVNCPATVKIEVKKGTKWITLLSRVEASVGSKAFAWDGKVGGSTLASGTYSVRVTPYYAGKAGAQKVISVKILPRPTIYLAALYPSTFFANGAKSQKLAFRWTRMTDVKVEVVTQSGRLVRTVYSAANKAPGSMTLYWNGRSSTGSLLASGYYRIKITCGARVLYKTFRIRR